MYQYNEHQDFVNLLKEKIAGREFDLAKQLIGLSDGDAHDEPHKHKQKCPFCEGTDRFWYDGKRSNATRRFFCNQCRPQKGWDLIELVKQKLGVGFLAAVRILAEAVGLSLPVRETKPPSRFQTWELHDGHASMIKKVIAHRPEISLADYQRAGAVGFSGGIAIPVFSTKGEISGYYRFGTDGSKKMSQGGKSGIAGVDARDALLTQREAKIIFKTAGISDYLVLSGLIADSNNKNNYYCFSNTCGELERPDKFAPILRPALEGKTVGIIADSDSAGAIGSQRWAEHLATFVSDVRIIRLPKRVDDCPVKDLRDFVSLGGTFQDILLLFDEAEIITQPSESQASKKHRLAPTGVRLLDRFCRKLKPYPFHYAGEKITHMEFVVQAIDELIRTAKGRKLDLAQRNGDFHVFNGQFWERILPESFHTFLRNAAIRFGVPNDLARYYKFQDKIREQFRDIANFPFVQDDKTIRINLKSGTLEFKEGQESQLVPFNKRHGLCYQLGYDFDPDADCPTYRSFMDRCVPDAANQFVLEEYAAYVFINQLNFERVLFLYGSGANGKSVFIAILKALLGKSNVTEYSLANITKKQEFRAMLAEGLLNVCAESANSLDIDVFKKIASREPLECRKLYENPITLTNYSRQLFATNVLPKTTESTEGFFRRFLIIPFNELITEAERNYRMNTVEFWEESGELPGILNRVIKGLQRLVQNGSFTKSESADAVHDEYRRNSNSVQLFMQDEEYQRDTVEKILLSELHGFYKEFCRENGYIAVSSQTMAERLRNIGYHVRKGSRNKTFVFASKTNMT